MITKPLISRKAKPLSGTVKVPGDKSISHRSVMFGMLAKGKTTVTGMLEGEDVLCTAAAANALGAKVERHDDGTWEIEGVGLGNLQEPDHVLDMGNSGTSTRLLMGILGSHAIVSTLTGDESLVKRPMQRVMTPLSQMGTKFLSRSKGRLPLSIEGSGSLKGIAYTLPVASAQVKSAILLAGLNAEGRTTVIESKATRDHTETMLRHFGYDVQVDRDGDNYVISLEGRHTELQGQHVVVPADPSSAGFPAVAAAIIPGSHITLTGVSLNERRAGLYTTLQEMGADLTLENERLEAGEPVADIVIKGTDSLKGITVPPDRVPSMIDEFPVLAMAAACADGTTYMSNLEELRVKESDRLAMVAQGLKACGVELEEGEDTLTIHGTGKPPRGGATVATALDHRIAMAFLVLGTVTDEPIAVDDGSPIATSFPNFVDLMNRMGTVISPQDG